MNRKNRQMRTQTRLTLRLEQLEQRLPLSGFGTPFGPAPGNDSIPTDDTVDTFDGFPDPDNGNEDPPFGFGPPVPPPPPPFPPPPPGGGFPLPPDPDPPTVEGPTIVGVDPDSNSELNEAPEAITIRFDRPLAPHGFDATAFQLYRVLPDGQKLAIFDYGTPPQLSLSADGTQLSIQPAKPMEAGTYQLFLTEDAMLLGQDGGLLTVQGSEELLTEFTIAEEEPFQVSLANAEDLGPLDHNVRTVIGQLDFLANPHDVRLYRIELTEGHFWRLGLEIHAQRDGGSLDTVLALFDAQGQLIAAQQLGRSDAHLDPYLFAGLHPGTYYIGVSGENDKPGGEGAYDPATGIPGTISQTQPGGSFRLNLVADPADSPTRLIHFEIEHADPTNPVPTGFTMQFSGALAIDQLGNPDRPDEVIGLLEAVDASGQAWTVIGVKYNEADATLSFLFRDRLPAGNYEIRLKEQGRLTDLAGYAPINEELPAGVLARFSVPEQADLADPESLDLGPLLPGEAAIGVDRFLTLAPGESTTIRAVLTFPGTYNLRFENPQGQVSIKIFGPDGDLDLQGGFISFNGQTLHLKAGEYTFQIEAVGQEDAAAWFQFNALELPKDSLLLNGVGQGPALNLRLIAPSGPIPRPPSVPPLTPGPGLNPNVPPTVQPPTLPTPSESVFQPPATGTTPTNPPSQPPLGMVPIPPPTLPATEPTPQWNGSPTPNPTTTPPESGTPDASLGQGTGSGSSPFPSGPAGLLLTLGSGLVGRPEMQGPSAAAEGVEGSRSVTVSAADGFEFFRVVNSDAELADSVSRSGNNPLLANQLAPLGNHSNTTPVSMPRDEGLPSDSATSDTPQFASIERLLDRLLGQQANNTDHPEIDAATLEKFDAEIEAALVLTNSKDSGDTEPLAKLNEGSHQEKSEGVTLAMGFGLLSAWFARRRAHGRRQAQNRRSNGSLAKSHPSGAARRFFSRSRPAGQNHST